MVPFSVFGALPVRGPNLNTLLYKPKQGSRLVEPRAPTP
jgi:hypothetical protein